MYGMTDSGKLFYDEITNFFIDGEGCKQSQCKINIYYKYIQDGYKWVLLSYDDECVYWYTSD